MKSVMNILLTSCLLLQAAAVSVQSGSSQLRRSPLHKAKQPGHTTVEEPEKAKEDPNTPVVVKVENKVRNAHKNVENKVRNAHKNLMGAIDKYRAEICAKMKQEYNMEFATFEACHEFMKKACRPGKDRQMDGDRKEIPSGEGYCHEYFPEPEEKVEELKEEKEEEPVLEVVASGPSGPSPGPAPGSAPAPAPAEGKKAPAPAPASAGGKASPAPAPAPGPMGAPGPGPAPGPFTPGKSGGKPWGAIAEDEAYYYKGGGEDVGRLHMSEKLKLPTNGYWGKLVEHEDGETQVGDWGKEFGPKSGHKDFEQICKENPDSVWCKRRGYGHPKSVATPAAAVGVFVPVVVAFFAALY